MKRLTIVEHESAGSLEKHYRQAKDGVEKTQWQVIWLLAKGEKSERVAEVTGYSQVWVRRLAQRYNAGGAAALGDKRHNNPGPKMRLSSWQQRELTKVLDEAAQKGEAWTGVQVAAWMSAKLREKVYPQRGWAMLRRLGFRSKVPRPRHAQANKDEQAAFKKRSLSPPNAGQ
jgi:transposase